MSAGQLAERLLDVRNLSIEIDTRNGPATVVDGIDLHVDKGETLGIVGESGCGKSLTMLSLVRLLPNKIRVSSGTATFEGRNLLELDKRQLRDIRGGRIGFVFQDPMTSLNPVMKIGAQLAEPLIHHRGMSKAAAWARAGELLKLTGVPGAEARLQSYPHELSGGMRQRVMIAIGLACNPELLIADEPTTALDVTIQAQIVDLVKELRRTLGMSVVWITHDLALIAGLADRIAVLYAGTVVEDAPVDQLFAEPAHPYTQGLLASIPKMTDTGGDRLASIGGAPPEPGRRPKGCPFAPRCPLVQQVCRDIVPALAPLRGEATRHRVACHVANDHVLEAA
jgi:peptide/nickel transport system ATP-binding protein